MSSFFRNVDSRFDEPRDIPLLRGVDARNPIKTLRARALLIDMEEGVVSQVACTVERSSSVCVVSARESCGVVLGFRRGTVQVMKGPLADLFDHSQLLTDVSGSGNNWAHGFCVYGPKYEDAILEQVHRAVEACDSPQVTIVWCSGGRRCRCCVSASMAN